MIPDNPYATLKRLDPPPGSLPPPPATPSPPPPPPPLPNSALSGEPTERKVYKNINEILSSHKSALRHQQPQGDGQQAQAALTAGRRASTDSLVSNPAMLHSGTILTEESTLDPVAPSPSPKVPVSPQPERPAPVLKPQVGRKPSLDRGLIQQKQQSIDSGTREHSLERKPTYEDTLKKCQSLTRARSKQAATAQVPSNHFSADGEASNGHAPLARHNSDPAEKKPPPPAKPASLATRALAAGKLEAGTMKKISHLPPSGLGHSPRPATGQRSTSLSRPEQPQQQQPQPHANAGAGSAFLGDLEQAMKKKVRSRTEGSSEPSRPFPNRFSSGEYDNVESGGGGEGKMAPQHAVPPIPKRSEETHLSWNRS